MVAGPWEPICKEALRRLPKDVLDARIMRLARANQLNLTKSVLPKEEWTDFDTVSFVIRLPLLKCTVKPSFSHGSIFCVFRGK